jgi:hypothetical protein
MVTNSTYDFGDVIRVQGVFRDEDDDLADPAEVAIWVKAPSSTVAVSTAPTNPSTGIFYLDYEIASTGQYYYRVFSDGSLQNSEEGMFRARRRLISSTG